MSTSMHGFTQGTVRAVAYSMLVLTTTVFFIRVALNFRIPKALAASDYFLFAAFVFHIAMCSLYIAVSPYMKRVYDVVDGQVEPYAGFAKDIIIMPKMVLATYCLYLMILWSVKISLLFLYRKFIVGISWRYTIFWWITMGACLLTQVGNYILLFRSCGTLSGFWSDGCTGRSRQEAQLASLYYTLAVDTLTNLMIMALPIGLTWGLNIQLKKKIAILTLFASGFVCIVFACVRAGEVGMQAAKPEAYGQPLDATTLAVWGMIECSVAVIIGSCPAFAVLLNASRANTMYESCAYRDFARNDVEEGNSGVMGLKTIGSMSTQQNLQSRFNDSGLADVHVSRERVSMSCNGRVISIMLPSEKSIRSTCRESVSASSKKESTMDTVVLQVDAQNSKTIP